jgi:hypothetical protein
VQYQGSFWVALIQVPWIKFDLGQEEVDKGKTRGENKLHAFGKKQRL